MIELKDLIKRFGRREILRIQRLVVEEGIHVLRGPNGSGKTTLLKILAGLVRPTEGVVRIWGRNPLKDASLRNKIEYVGHRSGLVEDLNAFENASLFLCPFGKRCLSYHRFLDTCERLGTTKILTRPVRTYSQGERTKVSVAIALASEAQILLLDEPFSPLDVESRFKLAGILQKRGNFKILILTAHGQIPDFPHKTLDMRRINLAL
ncbi:MAG: ABC transporter ATP-binding protein [Thermotogae bacterium]|nr:ABC transporter ATP-binding protein [Thermotogota bacterium]